MEVIIEIYKHGSLEQQKSTDMVVLEQQKSTDMEV